MKDLKMKNMQYLKWEIYEKLLLEIMEESILDERQRGKELGER